MQIGRGLYVGVLYVQQDLAATFSSKAGPHELPVRKGSGSIVRMGLTELCADRGNYGDKAERLK